MTVEFLAQAWQAKLATLLSSSARSLFIATPYIKHEAARWLLDALGGRARKRTIRTTLMTDISPDSVLGASLDISALLLFVETLERLTVFDVRRLHAKVYVADERQAIVTSGNLTTSAFARNYEYGVWIADPAMVRTVSSDMERYSQTGREIATGELARLDEVSRDFRQKYQRSSRQLQAGIRAELIEEWDQIVGPIGVPKGQYEAGSARFKGPIVEILSTRGALSTADLCDAIQSTWPYLCDDAILRVAKDGTRKRQWRHDIHTAQETLQRTSVIKRDKKGIWHIQSGGQR